MIIMPKFTKEQDVRLELGKLLNSFKIKIKDADQSSDAQLKLRLCKEIIDEYHVSMETLSNIDDYRKRTPRSREVAFKVIKDELRDQLAIAKGIYITEQMNWIFDSKNFSNLKKHIAAVKELIALARTSTKYKKEELKEQIQQAKKLLKELENQQQEEARVKETIINQPEDQNEVRPQEFAAVIKEEARVILETGVINEQVEPQQIKNQNDKNLEKETIETQIAPIGIQPPLCIEKTTETKANVFVMLQDLLNKANENDAQIVGRKYLLDFIASNQEQFNVLMANLPEDKKARFIEDMKPLQNLTNADSVKSTFLATMSWITMPMTVIVRSIAPPIVEQFNSLLPETQDSHCKAQLKKLISETLEDLRRNEATVTHQELDAKAPIFLDKEKANKESVKPIATQQKFEPIAKEAAQKALDKALLKTQQEHQQNFVPVAKEAAQKALDRALLKAQQEHQQNFVPVVKEAAQKSLDRALIKTQQEQHQQNFIPVAKEAATKARAQMLSKQKSEYFNYVKQLGVIVLDLQKKQKHNANYKNVTQVALDLYGKLKEAALFFEQPSAEGFEVFKQFCHYSINEAAGEFKQHRDLWHKVHPVLKGILGVIAALTVLPALMVATTKTGYVNTFFKTPETESSKKLERIKEMLERMEVEVEQKIKA